MPKQKKAADPREKLKVFQARIVAFFDAFEKLQSNRSPEREAAFIEAYQSLRMLLKSDEDTRSVLEAVLAMGAEALGEKSSKDGNVISFDQELLDREIRAMLRSNLFKKREIKDEIQNSSSEQLANQEARLTLDEVLLVLEAIKAKAITKVDPDEAAVEASGKKNKRTLKKAIKKQNGNAAWLICKGMLFVTINGLEDFTGLPTDVLADLIEDANEFPAELSKAADAGVNMAALLSKLSYFRGVRNFRNGFQVIRDAA